ncbi:hypothetical protein LIN78_01945 [Leeia sp. TBRC 13508]|uniref:Uncharacterized protein n=1 Tax=Leeia speluncae TaxID=2884804 RepID=A0ABS8D296_9NEIS|nr:hypothetical protein [Leeia speluncae]MCB6182317.1 hypothetical protein [Leeia speluncae]
MLTPLLNSGELVGEHEVVTLEAKQAKELVECGAVEVLGLVEEETIVSPAIISAEVSANAVTQEQAATVPGADKPAETPSADSASAEVSANAVTQEQAATVPGAVVEQPSTAKGTTKAKPKASNS